MERLLLGSLAHARAHGRTHTHTGWSRWEARRGATSELSPASLWISWKLFLLKVFPHVQLLIHPNSFFFMCIQYSHTYTPPPLWHPHPPHTHKHTHICMHKQLSPYKINIHQHAPTDIWRNLNMHKHKHILCVTCLVTLPKTGGAEVTVLLWKFFESLLMQTLKWK